MLGKVILFIFLLFLTYVPQAEAEEQQFEISVNSNYNIAENSQTSVVQQISITNKTEFYYTPSYTVTVGLKDIGNIEAFNSDGTIPVTVEDKDNGKSIKLVFAQRYAGISKTNTFTLKFTTKSIARKLGEIWEVSIPGIDKPEIFSSYTTSISVPESFGNLAITKPLKENIDSKEITFSKSEVGKSGIYMLFGDKQYYSFKLSYNISNPNLFPVRTEIAIPPQTNYQEVSISKFSEEPLNVEKDSDGNWIAEYRLLPQQKKKIVVEGFAEISSIPRKETLSSRQLKEYTSKKKYWETGDLQVRKEIEELKTPQDIYEYVVEKLTYNYSRVATDNLRVGGAKVLADPINSVCLEFSDLFVTLARAKGIPARLVEGYAFTDNPKIRPLSLVDDVLHAWPEYYDNNTKQWIMTDPTWGNTTNGMDYFRNLDFWHITFVMKGFDSEYPIPAGGYKFGNESQDVQIKFASKDDFIRSKKIKISDTFPKNSFPKVTLQGDFEIKNSGSVPLENIIAKVTSSRGESREFKIDYIPPFGIRKITTSFSDIPFLTNTDYVIKMQIEDKEYTKNIKISLIPDIKQVLLIGGIIGGATIITGLTFHTGSILIQRRKSKNSLRR